MIIKLKQKPIAKYPSALILSRSAPLLILLGVLFLFMYYFIDIPFSRYLSNCNHRWKTLADYISKLFSPFFLICAAPIVFFWNKYQARYEKLIFPVYASIFSLPIAFATIKLLKSVLHRYRPKRFFIENLYGFSIGKTVGSADSFPSGHACIIGAVAGILSCIYPRHTWKIMICACILSLARVITFDHYLSDVIFGVFIGAIISQNIYIFLKHKPYAF